jgi:hypothetical protein
LSREPGGRAGVDRYGPLVPRLGSDRGWSRYEDYGSEVPTAAVGKAGDRPIGPRGERQPFYRLKLYRLKRDVEYIHDGMPTGLSLRVWLPGFKEERDRRRKAKARELLAAREHYSLLIHRRLT